jgi:hypothetical protein
MNPYRVVVGNRKPMRMLSHGCTSILRIVFILACPISSIGKSAPRFALKTTGATHRCRLAKKAEDKGRATNFTVFTSGSPCPISAHASSHREPYLAALRQGARH